MLRAAEMKAEFTVLQRPVYNPGCTKELRGKLLKKNSTPEQLKQPLRWVSVENFLRDFSVNPEQATLF